MKSESIGGFLHYLMAECGVSPNTLAAYRSDLIRFQRWRKQFAPARWPRWKWPRWKVTSII